MVFESVRIGKSCKPRDNLFQVVGAKYQIWWEPWLSKEELISSTVTVAGNVMQYW